MSKRQNFDHQFAVQPWGGLKQIGMNVMVYRFGSVFVPVDAGILFADPNDFGIEAVIPDLSPLIQARNPQHWIITHGHEDHIGGVPIIVDLYRRLNQPLPKFLIPRFAFELVMDRLGSLPKSQRSIIEACMQKVEPNQEIALSSSLILKYFPVRHSIPSACGVGFSWTSPSGDALSVVHSADFKVDSARFPDGVIDVDTFQVWGSSPDFFLVDSTNADRPGRSASELELDQGMERVISQETGRVFLTMFSSNVFRLSQVLNVAARCGRRVYIAGRSLQTAFRIAAESGILLEECVPFDSEVLCHLDELDRLPRSQQLIVCSGSQGEPRSVLSQLGFERQHRLRLEAGDAVVFSSKLIPGNERGVYRLVNDLLRLGARVHMAEDMRSTYGLPVHASGHPRQDELRDVYRALQPRQVIPIHGGLKQLLANQAIALEEGASWGLRPEHVHVIENGSELVFEATTEKTRSAGPRWSLKERATHDIGQILRFEHFFAPSKEGFLRERKRSARGGVVSVVIGRSGDWSWELAGLWCEDSSRAKLEHWMADWVKSQLKWLRAQGAFEASERSSFQKELADTLANRLADQLGAKPLVIVHLVLALPGDEPGEE